MMSVRAVKAASLLSLTLWCWRVKPVRCGAAVLDHPVVVDAGAGLLELVVGDFVDRVAERGIEDLSGHAVDGHVLQPRQRVPPAEAGVIVRAVLDVRELRRAVAVF